MWTLSASEPARLYRVSQSPTLTNGMPVGSRHLPQQRVHFGAPAAAVVGASGQRADHGEFCSPDTAA